MLHWRRGRYTSERTDTLITDDTMHLLEKASKKLQDSFQVLMMGVWIEEDKYGSV